MSRKKTNKTLLKNSLYQIHRIQWCFPLHNPCSLIHYCGNNLARSLLPAQLLLHKWDKVVFLCQPLWLWGVDTDSGSTNQLSAQDSALEIQEGPLGRMGAKADAELGSLEAARASRLLPDPFCSVFSGTAPRPVFPPAQHYCHKLIFFLNQPELLTVACY